MKTAEIEAIRARWASAPTGPWCDDVGGDDGVLRVWFSDAFTSRYSEGSMTPPPGYELTVACVIFPGDMETYEAADFHTARALSQAPTDIADLLAEVDRLRAKLG